jgi:peptidoglycan/LPS O-acetylase OafA/YrhL
METTISPVSPTHHAHTLMTSHKSDVLAFNLLLGSLFFSAVSQLIRMQLQLCAPPTTQAEIIKTVVTYLLFLGLIYAIRRGVQWAKSFFSGVCLLLALNYLMEPNYFRIIWHQDAWYIADKFFSFIANVWALVLLFKKRQPPVEAMATKN